MAIEQIVPGVDIQEITVGTDDVDLVVTYGNYSTEIHVVSGSGTLVVETVQATLMAESRSLTVYPDWRKICHINKIYGSTNGSQSGLVIQLTFN